MQKIDRILATTDFSETSQTAFSLARQVAEKFDAEIVFLHVLDAHLPPLVFEPSGIPFFLVFDEKGTLIMRRKNNAKKIIIKAIDQALAS